MGFIYGIKFEMCKEICRKPLSQHPGLGASLEKVVPSIVPFPVFWIVITGIAELAGAVGLQIRTCRPLAGKLLAALFVCVWSEALGCIQKSTIVY